MELRTASGAEEDGTGWVVGEASVLEFFKMARADEHGNGRGDAGEGQDAGGGQTAVRVPVCGMNLPPPRRHENYGNPRRRG